jgi:hypothetical protein
MVVKVKNVNFADQSITTVEENATISVRNIDSIVGNSISSLEQRKLSYLNTNIEFKAQNIFKEHDFYCPVSSEKTDLGYEITDAMLYFIDPETDNAAASVPGFKKVFNFSDLDDVSQESYEIDILGLELDSISNFIEYKLYNGKYKVRDLEIQAIIDAKKYIIDFDKANANKYQSFDEKKKYISYVTPYLQNELGNRLEGPKIYYADEAKVESVDTVDSKITLNVICNNGSKLSIPEDFVIKIT